ncbi:cytochrome c biogenesis protein DipZ [Paraburkholderia saeva]|uniref:Protein DipZ n=1 Tax=Paraburkholderia saeva TaxID=2777537 RepID=A0A9N8S1Z9_9BURK|nr:cytochrome c biogenesis protein DipZ [Paraburkholderia saeva]CAG4926108.1 Protein DipZ [Paraburkholderia saeva]
MLLTILAFSGGALTILSPCILPVLPLVFSRSDQSFVRSGLPLLAGMALTFAAVASLAATGGNWATQVNQSGRWVALALFGVFGLTLLLPALADRLMRPLVSAGSRLTLIAEGQGGKPRIVSSVLLGVATGLLWAPCAGPILGLVLTGAALHGANAGTTWLLLSYAAGAATSLAIALFVGGRVLAAMKRSLGVGEWIRRAIGATILCGVAAIATGAGTTVLAGLSQSPAGGLEAKLVERFSGGAAPAKGADGVRDGAQKLAGAMHAFSATRGGFIRRIAASTHDVPLPVEGRLPSLSGAVEWINSPPLTAEQLRGKVVVVDVWTYSCINCLRTLPYVKAWSKQYRDRGLVVIGVHAPEFAFERDIGNVKRATHDLGVDYPVAVDNNFAIWRSLGNQYWPALYIVDGEGRIRYHQFGEGGYGRSEQVIQQLLPGGGQTKPVTAQLKIEGSGTQMASDMKDVRSGETYIGFSQAEGFVSPEGVLENSPRTYSTPSNIALNNWGLAGSWNIGAEYATLGAAHGKIVYRFHARDLHLVLGTQPGARPVRFRVTIDGAPPGAAHGSDVAADGSGTIDGQRLYQLVRQPGDIQDRTFAIEFLDPGVNAYAFTFG